MTSGKITLNDASNTNSVSLQAPATLASSVAFTLPDAYGSSGQALTTDGAGALSWTSIPSYQAGTATVAVSGTKTTFPSLSIAYARIGDIVTVTMESKGAGWVTTKNNSGGFTVPAIIPAALRPSDIISFTFEQNRNGVLSLGQVRVMSSGDLEFYRDQSFNDFVDNDTWQVQNRQSFSYNITTP